MSSTAASRPPSTPLRRSPTVSAATGTPQTSSLPRGATARAAASSRLSTSINGPAAARRGSIKGAAAPPPPPVEGSREALSASLKQETDAKEKLLVQLQDKDQIIATLKTENTNLSSALHAAETRVSELYADQGRMEEDLAARIEVIDKLRNQVRELEKEKRDIHRRYNEQTATFEAERQAFYDNEQHLKSRIQSLTQARKQPIPPSPSAISVAESEVEVEVTPPEPQPSTKQDMSDPQQEPAEMTALKLELTTLSTSHASLYATVQLLQGQLNDLKRVNNELQEENESYNILLREKTLNGQFDILRMGGARSERQSESPIPEEDDEVDRDADSLGSRDTGRSSRSVLDPVHEHPEEHEEEEIQVDAPELDPQFGQVEDGDVEEPGTARNPRSRHSRRRSSVAAPQGESLANLPITGPGLDLAAELGRAENKDILDGHASLDAPVNGDNKARKHKPSGADSGHKGRTGADGTLEPSTSSTNELDTLRSEVKSLKDANKALSLYASKIIDRIISQEGFEHVLAIDYEKSPTPSTTTFSPRPPPSPVKKARPQSAMFSRSTPATASNSPNIPPPERLTTFESLNANAAQQQSSPEPPKAAPSSRASRRSLSFDWASFSMFGGDKKAASPANLRPLTLTAGKPVVTGARKLDTYEDEEDRRERERLNATMKLMGIEKAPSPSSPLPPMLKSFSTPGAVGGTPTTPVVAAPTPTSSRFSFFRRSSSNNTNSETPSFNSSPGNSRSSSTVPHLTQETLEQAEAESTLAALDAHERQLSAEIAKGAGSGFTEIVRRGGDRRSSRRSGSGSTVWSAGMSKHEDED